MRRRRAATFLAAVVLAACGGLETPDLSTGAVAGRITPSYPGGRVYVFGRPELRAELAADGSFLVADVPSGAATLFLLDGGDHAASVATTVRGADVTWIGTAPAPGTDGGADPASGGGTPAPPMAPAGHVVARALDAAGAPRLDARFTLEGTDQADVAPDGSGVATLGPLPPGSFQLLVSAPGATLARVALDVAAGETVSRDVALP